MTDGIGSFKFRKKNNSTINEFLNGLNDRKYNFDYEPENKEQLYYISNALFEYNVIDKYSVNLSKNSSNRNSLSKKENAQRKSFTSDRNNDNKNKDNINNDKINNDKINNDNTNNIKNDEKVTGFSNINREVLKKDKNEISNFKNSNIEDQNKSNLVKSEIKNDIHDTEIQSKKIDDETTSKYFNTNRKSSNAHLNDFKLNSLKRKGKGKEESDDTGYKKDINKNNKNNNINSIDISMILNGVNITISGIENPERGEIRNLAIKMGAKYQPKWNNSSTHLICPVKGTPKYNEAKASNHGKIVKPSWIYKCYEKKKRLSEENFSLDNKFIYISSDEDENENDIIIIDEEKSEDEKTKKEIETQNIKEEKNNKSNTVENYIIIIDEEKSKDEKTKKEIETQNIKKEKNNKSNTVNNNKNKINNANDNINYNGIKNQSSLKKLKQVSLLLFIPSIFKNLRFYFDDTIQNKSKKELSRYVLGHGGKISSDIDDSVTHYCTMKNTGEVTFNGIVINPSYIINCHNKNNLL